MNKRIVITGMAVNTPLGDTLDGFLANLLEGQSAITHWRSVPSEQIYSKVGGDLGSYDVMAKLSALQEQIPEAEYSRLKALVKKVPACLAISMLVTVDAWLDSGLFNSDEDDFSVATVVAGHNLNELYTFNNHETFSDEPDFIDGLVSLYALDTTHASCISEVLQLKGASYTVGGACASGNMALRSAIDEIRYHGVDTAVVAAPMLEFSPLDLQGMALMGAISYQSFNDEPHRASRPYDLAREGFIPSHGTATLIVESLEHALARGAHIHAEILGVESSADGNHLPQPSQAGQARLIRHLLDRCDVAPEQVDYINAHATSTPLGDLTELRAIKDVFGSHAYQLKLNAPKSLFGHTCWSSAIVETVAAVLQMQKGVLHPSINIDNLDPEVDLDICKDGPVTHKVDLLLKNSFGFGGLNSVSLIRRYENEQGA